MTREEAIKLRPHYAELYANIPPMPPKWKPGPGQASMAQIEELIRLVPAREEKIWELVYAGLTDEQARGVLEVGRGSPGYLLWERAKWNDFIPRVQSCWLSAKLTSYAG